MKHVLLKFSFLISRNRRPSRKRGLAIQKEHEVEAAAHAKRAVEVVAHGKLVAEVVLE